MGMLKRLKRQQNLKEAEEQVALVEDMGHKTIRFTDYHWRIDDIDVWPSSKKFMVNHQVRYYKHIKDIFNAPEFNVSVRTIKDHREGETSARDI